MKRFLAICMAAALACAVPQMGYAAEENSVQTTQEEITQEEATQEEETATVARTEYIPVLMYHHFILNEVEPGNGVTMSQNDLASQIQYFREQGYKIISLEELDKILTKSAENRGVLPPRLMHHYFFLRYSDLLLSVSCVYVYQFLQVFVSLHSFLLVDREQSCSLLRICSLQSIVTYLAVKECLVVFLLRSLAVKEELVALSSRIEPEVIPVSALYCQLFLCLSLAHTLLDTVVDTRSVCDDQ